jgi:hypothetical protein
MLFFHAQKSFLRPPAVAAVQAGYILVADKLVFIIKCKVRACKRCLHGSRIAAAHGQSSSRV